MARCLPKSRIYGVSYLSTPLALFRCTLGIPWPSVYSVHLGSPGAVDVVTCSNVGVYSYVIGFVCFSKPADLLTSCFSLLIDPEDYYLNISCSLLALHYFRACCLLAPPVAPATTRTNWVWRNFAAQAKQHPCYPSQRSKKGAIGGIHLHITVTPTPCSKLINHCD